VRYVPGSLARAGLALSGVACGTDDFLLRGGPVRIPPIDVQIRAAVAPCGFDVGLAGLHDAVLGDADAVREAPNELVVL
jgi:hypothetical protein